jgi:protein SCO1/2
MGTELSCGVKFMKFSSRKLMALALAVLGTGMAVFQGARSAALDNSRWGANYFPNVELITQDGKKVKLYDDLLKGKIVAVNMIYTRCVDSCPLETARLAQVQRYLGDRMGKDIFFYSITLDPKHDTPEVLKDYAEKYHAGPGWLFLTGKKDDIDLVSKKLGLYSDPDPNNRDGHTPGLLVGNESTGQWMRNSATDNPRFLATMLGDFMDPHKDPTKQTRASYNQAKPMDFDKGQYFFSTRCAACHSVGQGDKIGPDLIGVTSVRDPKWLTRFIMMPDKMLEEKDPIATALFEQYKKVLMPNLRMGDQDTAAIIDYLARVTAARDKMMKEPAANDPATANSVAKAPSPGNQDLQRH